VKPAADPSFVADLVGLETEAARELAEKKGLTFRVGERDGERFLLTLDYRLDRVTVSIVDGIITQASLG